MFVGVALCAHMVGVMRFFVRTGVGSGQERNVVEVPYVGLRFPGLGFGRSWVLDGFWRERRRGRGRLCLFRWRCLPVES